MLIPNNCASKEDADLLARITELPHEFHLTGSRSFGNARPDSDWDFVVEPRYSVGESLDDLCNILFKVGFRYSHNSNYQDTATLSVMRYQGPDGVIDVQIGDVDLKMTAQRYIKSQLFSLYNLFAAQGDKGALSTLWDTALRIAILNRALVGSHKEIVELSKDTPLPKVPRLKRILCGPSGGYPRKSAGSSMISPQGQYLVIEDRMHRVAKALAYSKSVGDGIPLPRSAVLAARTIFDINTGFCLKSQDSDPGTLGEWLSKRDLKLESLPVAVVLPLAVLLSRPVDRFACGPLIVTSTD